MFIKSRERIGYNPSLWRGQVESFFKGIIYKVNQLFSILVIG